MCKSLKLLFICCTLFFSVAVFATSVDDTFRELNEYRLQKEAQDLEYTKISQENERMAITQVQNTNIFYLMVLAIPFILLMRHVLKAQQKGKLKSHQKLGISIILVSGLALVFAVMLSQPWVPQIDMIQNIFGYLRLQFLPIDNGFCLPGQLDCYTVDIPTKIIVLGLLCIGTYGFITYLGLTGSNNKALSEDDI